MCAYAAQVHISAVLEEVGGAVHATMEGLSIVGVDMALEQFKGDAVAKRAWLPADTQEPGRRPTLRDSGWLL